MKRSLAVLLLAWTASAALAQTSRNTEIASRTQEPPARLVPDMAGVDKSYRVGPQDVLAVEIWNGIKPEYDKRLVTVEQEGTINLPLVNDVKVDGLNVPQISDKLKELYGKFIKRPGAYVWIEEYNSRQISVIGEVKEPGRLTLKGEMRLMEALAEAGDVTETASRLCRIMRGGERGKEPEIFEVDLDKLAKGEVTLNLVLEPGDTVIVLTNEETVYVSGHVNKPGQYDFSDGLSAQQAIILAGGVAETGASNRAKVYRRKEDGKMQEFKVDAKDQKTPFKLESGDSVFVPQTWL